MMMLSFGSKSLDLMHLRPQCFPVYPLMAPRTSMSVGKSIPSTQCSRARVISRKILTR